VRAPGQGSPLGLLYYVETLGVGGAVQTTVTVARQMKACGHRVVFASDAGPLKHALDQAGIPHLHLDAGVRHPSPGAVARLAAAVRRHRIDLICPNGFDCTLDAVPAGLLTGRPVLPTYGGMFNLPYPHPRLPLVNVFSDELKVDLVDRYGWKGDRIRTTIARIDGERFHPGVDGTGLRSELGIAPDEPVLVMVCRHDRLKLEGILTLLDASADIHRAVPRARIVLLGDGPAHSEVLDRIDRIHAETEARFLLAPGSMLRTPEAFAMADLVVANGARSALEGMACGRAVLSVGPNGFCGVLAPGTIEGFRRFNFDKGRIAGNPLADRGNLVRCVERILGDEQLRKRLGGFSLEYAREHLVVQAAAPRYERMYREAIGRWPAGRLGRWRILADWCAVVTRFYGYRIRRRLRWISGQPPGALEAPAGSLDPEWRIGLDLDHAVSPQEPAGD
jgi:glycosyltransferase involved in cell wall biosynthesis